MFGKKRVLLVVLVCLAAGTGLAGLATTLPVMIVARVIQGLGGAIFPLAFGIIRDEFPRERVAGGIALISGLLGIGGGLGIVLAGPILQHLDYHWLFWIPLALILLTTIATVIVIPESPIRAPGTVNWTGAILLSLWLICLLLAISEAPTWGWLSARVIGLIVLAVVIGARLGQGRVAVPEPARRHADDATPRCVDDEPHRLPDRLRDVQLVRAHPAVRRDAHLHRTTGSARP